MLKYYFFELNFNIFFSLKYFYPIFFLYFHHYIYKLFSLNFFI